MNKRILVSLSVIGVVAAIAVGGTIAYFSDTETSIGNTLTAGSLDLSVNDQNPLQGPVVTIADMKPSEVKYSEPITLRVHNNPGKLWKHIKAAECKTVTQTEPEQTEDPNGIKNQLTAYIWFNLEKKVGNEWVNVIPGNIGMVDPDFTSCWIPLGEYGTPGNPWEVTIRQSFHLDKNVTNWAQSDQCTFEEEFMVTQINAPDPRIPEGKVWDGAKCVITPVI